MPEREESRFVQTESGQEIKITSSPGVTSWEGLAPRDEESYSARTDEQESVGQPSAGKAELPSAKRKREREELIKKGHEVVEQLRQKLKGKK